MSFRVNTNIMAQNALRNLSQTGMQLGKSVERLSTGLRINSAADDPAGLIASEQYRAQIAGLDQAIRNNQDALNYAKTAEGALDEVGSLLRDARTLALSYTGTLDANQIQANQNQLTSILESIDRISSNTQFGTKALLDGSAGVQASVVNATAIASINLGGKVGTQAITADGSVTVDVTTAATKASHSGTNTTAAASLAAYQAAAVGTDDGSFSINGTTFDIGAAETWGDVVTKINNASAQTGVVAEATYAGGNGNITLRSEKYGALAEINLVDSGAVINAAAGSTAVTGVNGVASVTVGSLNAVTFTGGQNGNDGLTMTDSAGNRVVLTEAGNAVSTYAGAAQVLAGTSTFQIGANSGQTTSLSLGNYSSSALSLSGLAITSQSGADAALTAIDAAIDDVTRDRGNIGSFMRNNLETNIRSLGIARENLSATNSTIRDTDVAAEMTQFTRLQILQQSGLAVLAQANLNPQGVLSLLS